MVINYIGWIISNHVQIIILSQIGANRYQNIIPAWNTTFVPPLEHSFIEVSCEGAESQRPARSRSM